MTSYEKGISTREGYGIDINLGVLSSKDWVNGSIVLSEHRGFEDAFDILGNLTLGFWGGTMDTPANKFTPYGGNNIIGNVVVRKYVDKNGVTHLWIPKFQDDENREITATGDFVRSQAGGPVSDIFTTFSAQQLDNVGGTFEIVKDLPSGGGPGPTNAPIIDISNRTLIETFSSFGGTNTITPTDWCFLQIEATSQDPRNDVAYFIGASGVNLMKSTVASTDFEQNIPLLLEPGVTYTYGLLTNTAPYASANVYLFGAK